jgi:hypothetical protein
MDLQGVKVDPSKIEQGDWVDNIPEMGDLRLKVRGVNCAAWRGLARKLAEAVPRNKKVGGRIAQDEQDRIINECLLAVGVIDWENLTSGGAPLPYAKDAARQFLTDPAFQAFRDAALWACTAVGADTAASSETDAKNSPAP